MSGPTGPAKSGPLLSRGVARKYVHEPDKYWNGEHTNWPCERGHDFAIGRAERMRQDKPTVSSKERRVTVRDVSIVNCVAPRRTTGVGQSGTEWEEQRHRPTPLSNDQQNSAV